METQIVAATIAVLTGLMALGIILAYRAHRKRRKPQEQRDDVTLHVKLNNPPAQQAIPRPPKVVRAPEGCRDYLTAGKVYEVTRVGGFNPNRRHKFYCIDDVGQIIFCIEKKCHHLNGGDWIVVEREGEEREKPSIEQQLFEAQAEATRLAGELEAVKDQRDNAIEQRDMFNQSWEIAERQRDEARTFANDLRDQLDRALVVIKDLEGVNAELLAIVQGEEEQPEPKPLRLVTDLGKNECIHCPTKPEAEAICKLMHEAGLKWASGKSLLEYNKWADEKEKTVYYPSRSSYGSILYAQENGRTIHPASDFLPPDFYEHKGTEAERPDDSEPGEQAQPATTEPAIDWTKPVAFPEGYEVPKGTRVIKIGEDDVWVKKDSVGVVVETSNDPIVKWENKDYDLRGSKCDWAQPSYFLAPENPTDHPHHPEFKGNKQ